MHALVDRCYSPTIYGCLYTELFGSGGLAVTKATYITAKEAVKLILDCGGTAVLAHPFQYDSMDYLPQLVTWGITGIEYQHHTQTPERQEKVKSAAIKFNIFLTGGSDFHGFYSEKTMPLGSNKTELDANHPLLQG
jgi:predicted metal-dependent phosphoesterase TrpH